MKSKYKLYTITKSGLHYLPQNYLITYSWKLLSIEAINPENEKERIYRNVAFVCTVFPCFISVSIQGLIYFAVKGTLWRTIFCSAFCNLLENVPTYTNDLYIKYVMDIIFGWNMDVIWLYVWKRLRISRATVYQTKYFTPIIIYYRSKDDHQRAVKCC